MLQCTSDVKLCILKLPSSSYCNNCSLILTRMSIFLLIWCYRLLHEKQNTNGNYTDPMWWSVAFHSLFWLLSKCYSGLGNNFPLCKTCSYAMQASLQQLFLLFITITQSFCHEKVFPKKHFWHFCPFSAWPFGTGSLHTFSFFLTRLPPLLIQIQVHNESSKI